MINRRSLILGAAITLAAPSIVRASALMPLRGIKLEPHILVRWHNIRMNREFPWIDTPVKDTINMLEIMKPHAGKTLTDVWLGIKHDPNSSGYVDNNLGCISSNIPEELINQLKGML
jgi:hypothetical protein